MTDNISYELDKKSIDTKYVLRKQATLCSGYSNLLKELCDHANIDCQIVDGYAKSFPDHIGKFKTTNHAWNVVNLNNNWYLVDATWAAGSVNKRTFIKRFNEFYFLPNPEEFIFSHLPVKSKWTLSEKVFTKEEFEMMPIYTAAFFELGIQEIEKVKGEVDNKFVYKFEAKTPIVFSSYQFNNKKEYRDFEMPEIDGIYHINIDFDEKDKGACYIYLNHQWVLTLLVKEN